MRRAYGAGPIRATEVSFNNAQRIVDVGVRQEQSQALCYIGDSYPVPHIEKVVGVLVLCPISKGKCLKYGECARTAYRNIPCCLRSGRDMAGQL